MIVNSLMEHHSPMGMKKVEEVKKLDMKNAD
jgi:hypothetical protein